MNKLYILAALSASVYAAYNTPGSSGTCGTITASTTSGLPFVITATITTSPFACSQFFIHDFYISTSDAYSSAYVAYIAPATYASSTCTPSYTPGTAVVSTQVYPL